MNDKLIQENVLLARLTTLEVGGAARFFARCETEAEIIAALQFADARGLPVLILGGGSNLLVCDNGFDGVVMQIANRGIEFEQTGTSVLATAQAGENWDEFVRVCVAQNLAGIECLSGIPGTTGATPVQNVGAYGQEVADTIERVRVFDRETKEIKNLSNADCQFDYRRSIFNTTHKNRFVVLAATFRLTPNGAPNVRYQDLQKYFAANRIEPTLATVRAAVLTVRAAKSMVISATDENRRSAGSFFKNPIVTLEKFREIETTARQLNLIQPEESAPHYPAGNQNVKVPAAWLIEKSGFKKGYGQGRVGLSTNHTLAVVNRSGATAREIIELVGEIQQKVLETFAVKLQPEPIWVGFEQSK